ncbi:hypothetical protein QOZ95_005130 [Paenibacillus brasilensis]|uniref:Uncharacterized protein n=1 Tax=Paenibacillus brasilensis TaxID=128574 RepID=A0ABU0L6K8_9BACL|nr:hypothetical protein [Paenibacillus brasilensis]
MIEENGKTNNLKFSPVFIPILYSQNNNVLVEKIVMKSTALALKKRIRKVHYGKLFILENDEN